VILLPWRHCPVVLTWPGRCAGHAASPASYLRRWCNHLGWIKACTAEEMCNGIVYLLANSVASPYRWKLQWWTRMTIIIASLCYKTTRCRGILCIIRKRLKQNFAMVLLCCRNDNRFSALLNQEKPEWKPHVT
jgi:hypothetical protein